MTPLLALLVFLALFLWQEEQIDTTGHTRGLPSVALLAAAEHFCQ